MWRVLEKNLIKRKKEKYRRYQTIKKMMAFCEAENKIGIDSDYYNKILVMYIEDDIKRNETENIKDRLHVFFEKIVDLYLLNRLPRYNFIVDESDLEIFLKEWLKEKKDDLKKFMDFYLGNSQVDYVNVLFENDYFEIFKIQHKKMGGGGSWLVPYPDYNNTVLRLVTKGKVYYNDGTILGEGFYILSNRKNFLERCMVLSDEVSIIFIVIKNSFTKMFNLIEPDTKVKVKSNIDREKLERIMNSSYLREHPFFFFESLVNFFEIKLSKGDVSYQFLKSIEEEKYLNNVYEIISRNINMDIDDIQECIERELMISEEILNSYLVKNLNITLRKWIIKLKLKFLLEESYFGNREIEEVRKKLAISNIKSLRYNLKTYYDISVKDLKRV